jgi:hypothetical protein
MPRSKTNSGGNGHHSSILAAVEQQYLAALRYSRDQLDRRIKALEYTMTEAVGSTPAKSSGKASATKAKTGQNTKSTQQSRKPRNYDVLKAKITKPMTMLEMLKALGMKEKQEGTLRQTMQNYPGLFTSDGKRPATYTLDASR